MSLENLNRFVKNPVSLDIARSRFPRNFTHKTTFISGKLIPLFIDEVLPGDTFDVNWSSVIRMLTPAVPVMDNAFFDMYFFFVPNRLCTNGDMQWQRIQGENTGGYWAPTSEATLANTSNSFSLKGKSVTTRSFANYIGLPIGSNFAAAFDNIPISLLPFNAYIRIWNEWFRDQNTQAPKSLLNTSSTTGLTELLTDCLDVNRLHDYFTSALPAPQKGDSVLLPLGSSAIVRTATTDLITGASNALKVKATDGTPILPTGSVLGVTDTSGSVGDKTTTGLTNGNNVYPTNLYVDLATATAATVNQLRQAFAIQRLLEKDARGGSRYREILKAHFGVTIPDLTIQVPEYLGGKRVPLNITQVLQTSGTGITGQSGPLGATGAFSNTSCVDRGFVKSFNEYGFIIGVGCVRTEQSYSQGIPKYLTRNRRYDWYLPALANLGEQPVFARELYVDVANASNTQLQQIFGYQEAWAEYRFHPNLVTGNLAPNANDNSMTAWTYTNKFTSVPVLNSSFMVQPSSQIGDTLVVTNTNNQFVADFFFEVKTTRPMPLYSIPGLIDHH